MRVTQRQLIISHDERVLSIDRPIIFIGSWCIPENRAEFLGRFNYITAKPYGLDAEQRLLDQNAIKRLEIKLFPELCDLLNKYHKINYDQRYWTIVLGNWLHRALEVILNRVKTLEQCIQNYNLSGIKTYALENYELCSKDTYSAIFSYNDSTWNEVLSLKIINHIKPNDFTIEWLNEDKKSSANFKLPEASSSFTNIAFGIFQKFFNYIFRIFCKDIFVINSYLPKYEEIKLNLKLSNIPWFWSSVCFSLTALAKPLERKKIFNLSKIDCDSLYEEIVCLVLPGMLPVSMVEGFQEMNQLSNSLPWPKNPKVIFTSNSFDNDDLFKIWTANKVNAGSRYIIGQHGNNYGVCKYMNPSIEETIADKFLTWGWSGDSSKYIPTFIFKTAGIKRYKNNPKGGALLVELHPALRITTWDDSTEFIKYQNKLKILVDHLPKHIVDQLTVRLYNLGSNYSRPYRSILESSSSNIKIDEGINDIKKLYIKNRLVIHTYNSTGLLETLSQNIPSIIYWQDGLNHLRESSTPIYSLLLKANILFIDPVLAAKKISSVWEHVDEWWMSQEVQNARYIFCEMYAREVPNHINFLSRILNRA